MTIGPEIKCVVCGARPWPELSLPEVVRQDFDLMKLRPNGVAAGINDADARWHAYATTGPIRRASRAIASSPRPNPRERRRDRFR
jgi:hypothetical protein